VGSRTAHLTPPSGSASFEILRHLGDALDFWRVEEVRGPTLLRLRAEMKVPGRAWLQYEVQSTDGGSRLVQTAFFEPKGLPGLAYWYVLYPVHGLIFRGTVCVVAERAVRRADGGPLTS
jgi:hypothetical protein